MVQPVAASSSCIQSYSPCSLISDLIQRVAECVAAIFNTIAGLFSSCFGRETTPQAARAVAAPALPIPSPALQPIAAPALPIAQPDFNPMQMIGPIGALRGEAYDAAVENGTRFLMNELRGLKQADPSLYVSILATMESHPIAGYAFSPFFICYLLSEPSLDCSNNPQLFDLRAQFAALTEQERAIVIEGLKTKNNWSRDSTERTRDFARSANTFSLVAALSQVFSGCAIAARRELAEAHEIIDSGQLIEEGTRFFLRECLQTDAREYDRMLARLNTLPGDCFTRVIVYHLVFPEHIVGSSNPARNFIPHLMQTRDAKQLVDRIAGMRTAFCGFSEKEQRNILAAWQDGAEPIASTQAFFQNLIDLNFGFNQRFQILYPSALAVKQRLAAEGL